MPVRKAYVIAFHKARSVVHSAPPARRPITAVAPGAVFHIPLMISHKRVEHACKTLFITRRYVVIPLAPTHYIGTRAYGVVARKVVTAVTFAYFTADKAVAVLFCIKIVQRFLEIKRAPSVFCKHQNKRRIPHKNRTVECRVDKICHKSAVFKRFFKVCKRKFPHLVIAVERTFISVHYRHGKKIFNFFVFGQIFVFRIFADKSVIFHIRLIDIKA